MEYALCWRQEHVILFPLKLGKDDRAENKREPKEKLSRKEPHSCLPSHNLGLLGWNPKIRSPGGST
jgi:hypothetical protein